MRRTKRKPPTKPTAVAVGIPPRLVDRNQLASYVSESVATIDAWRARGVLPRPVPLPSANREGELLRRPIWDLRDIDRWIDEQKAGANGGGL